MPERRLRLLVACGAAGGIAATFNAPIAGVFFALELILRDFEAESFGVVVLGRSTADGDGAGRVRVEALPTLPAFRLVSPLEYSLYAALGVAGGFRRRRVHPRALRYRGRRRPDLARPRVAAARPSAASCSACCCSRCRRCTASVTPCSSGGRRAATSSRSCCILIGGKIVATSLTIAIGGSGGVFAPSLFMGAMLGSAFGPALHSCSPARQRAAGAYGLVGMGAVFAAAARAPITAVIIVFELTGEYASSCP